MLTHISTCLRWLLSLGSLAALPFFALGGVYGLAGANPGHHALMWLGYFMVGTSAFASFWIKRVFWLVPLGAIIFAVGAWENNKFWAAENAALCARLRANPTCTETSTGFLCSDVDGSGFVSGKGMCARTDRMR